MMVTERSERRKPYESRQTDWNMMLGERLVIPMNQRQYSWEEDDVKKFWDDMINIFEENKYTIRMGEIILYKSAQESPVAEVYEGQSRTLTTWMIVVAMANQYATLKNSIYPKIFIDENDDSELPSDYQALLEKGYKNIPKIKCVNDYDNSALMYIANQTTVKWNEEYDEYTRIVEIYEYIHKWLQELAWPFDKMRKFYNFILKAVDINLCISDDLDYVSTIFEWSNNRGRKVADEDVVKNRVLCRVPQDQKYRMYEKWQSYATLKKERLGKTQYGKQILSIAIQVYNKRLVASKEFSVGQYDKLVKSQNICRDMDNFFDVVEKVHQCYHQIEKDRIGQLLSECIATEGYIYQLLPTMTVLGFSSTLVRMNADWGIRNMSLVPKARTFNNLEYATPFIELTNKVLAGEIVSMKMYEDKIRGILLEKMDPRIRDTEACIQALRDARFKKNNKKVLCILKYYELTKMRTDTCCLPTDITLEHILPQKNRCNYDEDIIYQLGNCTLIEGKNSENGHKGNKSIKDKDFAYKSKQYGLSSFLTTRDLAKYECFNEDHVRGRTMELATQIEHLTNIS